MIEDLLPDLCCPDTRQPLRVAAAADVELVNAAIAAGRLKNQSGNLVQDRIDAGVVREDGTVIYPVRGGTPVMLVAEAILMRDV